MKYTRFIIISSLICATLSFDMKYSLQKHEWKSHIPSLTADDTIDDYDRLTYNRNSKPNEPLNSTDLAGGVTIAGPYVLAASFEVRSLTPACLFSIERSGKQKLALCLEQLGGLDHLTVTLYSANIPNRKVIFEQKIFKDTWNELLVSVNETGTSLLFNCEHYEDKQFESKISKQIHLTEDMILSVGYPLSVSGLNFEASIKDLDLYSPADDTTIMALCPDFNSSPFQGANHGNGVIGPKGDRGEPGYPGLNGRFTVGLPGEKGDQGFPGRPGIIGLPGAKGSCQCTEDVVSSLLESMPAIRGSPGFDGMPGMKGAIGLTGARGYPGHPGPRGLVGIPGRPGSPGIPGPVGPPGPPGREQDDSTASSDEREALKSIASGMKLLSDYIIEKTNQEKHLTEQITKYNERLTTAEKTIETLRKAMLVESNR